MNPQMIIEEWTARVANIAERQIPAWKRVLCNQEIVRDFDTAMDVVKEIAAECERGQHKKNPGLTHFEKKYRELIAKFERERYESDDTMEGCSSCAKSGVIAIVMAWSIKDYRYKPVPRDRTPKCDAKAYRCYIPCSCPRGLGINANGPNYSRDILRRLHYHCTFESNSHADDHMLACMNA